MASWQMWAHERDGVFRHVGSRFYVDLHQCPDPAVEVLVTEDAAGPYWGWIHAGKTFPTMIWAQETLFRICFAGVPEEIEAAGQGRVIRLHVERRA